MKKNLFAISCFFYCQWFRQRQPRMTLLIFRLHTAKTKREMMQEYIWKLYDSYEVNRRKTAQNYIQKICTIMQNNSPP